MEPPLTHRQLRFVFEYLQDQNASAAAVRAGYSEKSRAAQAHELMNNPAVQERIRVELQSLLAELRCSALELMKERKRAAFFRAGKMFKAGWELAAPDEMEEETAAALEVRTVLRKGDPVVHMRQPDRNKALRALERVHERLDVLNERHYARLEKAGRVKSLEEIEAMDGGGASAAAAADFSEKPMVFSGSTTNVVESAADFGEKAMVLSGSTTNVVEPAVDFRNKAMVPQGGFLRGVCSGATAHVVEPAADFGEKAMVLSGSTTNAVEPAIDFRKKPMAFSGSGLPRPQASPWLLQAARPPAPAWARLRAA